MIECTYWEVYQQGMKDLETLRLQLVRYALQHSVSAAAREFATTRKTVRKWRDRYQAEGRAGLRDRSRAPHTCPHKLDAALEDRICQLRQQHPYMGAWRLQQEFDLPASHGAIYRVLSEAGLITPRTRKYQQQRNLRAVKRAFAVCERIQLDLKHLEDIPQYYPYLWQERGYPQYQFSARDVRTGVTWLCYGQEKSLHNTTIFFTYLAHHLQACGVDLSAVTFQIDHGTEWIGPAAQTDPTPTLFEQAVAAFEATYRTIPPGQCTYQSDVEAMHRLIEDEFYDYEDYQSPGHLCQKAYTYVTYFNTERRFRYKENQTPLEILDREASAEINTAALVALPPILLDPVFHDFNFKGGYHVPSSVK